MSVEAPLVAKVVQEGAPALRKLYSAGVSHNDFPVYEEEFLWIESRLGRRKPLNRRVFRERFPDFEWALPREDLADLIVELREERAMEELTSIITTMAEEATKDNALDLAVQMRDRLAAVTRKHAPMNDVNLDEWRHVIEEMRQGMIMAKQGLSLGILTGDPFLDYHLGGWMPGQFVEVLGRTGEGKSYWLTARGWHGKKKGHNVGMFSPEQNAHEVRCRYHTLASADKDVKEALGLKHSFRNRSLMFRNGFNLKSYQRLLEYLEAMPGNFHLLAGGGMSERMSVGYVEDRIVELELDLVIVDPIYMLKPVRTTRDGNGWQETAWTAEALHNLGERYSIPIVFTNQADDKQKSGRDDAPHRSAGFGSQQMAHLSDYVLGVKHLSEENMMICRASKSRFGQGHFRYDLKFYANTGVVKETTPLGSSYYNGNDADADGDDVREMVESAIRGEE